MKKIKIIIAICLLYNSCTTDLSLKPISNISSVSFWQTEDDAIGALFGMYDNFRSQAENQNLFYLGEARSDALEASFATGPNKYWDNILDASTPGPDWRGFYRIIHDANLIIKYVPNIKFSTADEKNNILAQAYAMRAYTYFVLVKSWGDVPLVLTPTEGDFAHRPRTTVQEVFTQIKDDIEQSLNLFPSAIIPKGRNVWSHPSVNVLKASVYLWTGKLLGGRESDFQVALKALNEINTSKLNLLDDYNDIFDYSNKGNNEILIAINFKQFESGSNWGYSSYMHPAYVSPLFDAKTINDIGVMGGSPDYSVSRAVRSKFSNDDQRKDATFYEMYTNDPDSGERTYYGSFSKKYDGFIDGGVRYFLDDIIIYRYADLLLLRAEVKNALGQDPTEEINQIRMRAYGGKFSDHIFTSGSQEENNDAILEERLLEFTLEGKRWWDLIRFGKAYELVPSLQGKENGIPLLFPIPESTLSLNSEIRQNAGY